MKHSRVYSISMILYKNYASEFHFKPYLLYKSRLCILPNAYTLRKRDIFLCEPRALVVHRVRGINICTVHHWANHVQNGHIVFNGVILDIMI